jgi:predicted RNA-binding protein YlqC (UPF0109 family)
MPVDPNDSLAYDVLFQIVSSLVDRAEAVRITPTPQPEGMCFTIKVQREDIGKIIGKQGRTARALRIILWAVGMKMRRRYSLDIVPDLPPQL